MSSYKYKHLTLDDRITIQKALKEGQTFVEIGALIGKDPSTVSKEVKAHLDYRNTGTRSRGYNPCRHRKRCTKQYICGEDMPTYLREANTAKSVTEAVNHLYEILGRERFGRNGRTDYEQKYSVQSMIKKYIQLLEDEY